MWRRISTCSSRRREDDVGRKASNPCDCRGDREVGAGGGVISNVTCIRRAEPGNRGYTLHQDLDNPARFFFYETWASREALNVHLTTPHFKALDKNAKPLIARELSIAVLRAFDEAGSPT